MTDIQNKKIHISELISVSYDLTPAAQVTMLCMI